MSGPKDFSFTYTAARLALIQARIAAQRQARAAVTRAVLDRARANAGERLASLRSARSAVVRKALDAKRRQAERSAEQAREDAAERAADVGGKAEEPRQEGRPTEVEVMGSPAVPAAVPADGLAQEVEETIRELAAWEATLASDDAVSAFGGPRAEQWRQGYQKLTSDIEAGLRSEDAGARCKSLMIEAQAIHAQAGELKEKFDTRNELLRDVMDSFKEIGFFVSDPYFERPDDPTGPVIVKAACGSEEVTASVDLSDTIRSVWNGVASEQCKDSFFDYVEKMGEKGVEVTPVRTDLGSRPVLKQKGANELPRGGSKRAGL